MVSKYSLTVGHQADMVTSLKVIAKGIDGDIIRNIPDIILISLVESENLRNQSDGAEFDADQPYTISNTSWHINSGDSGYVMKYLIPNNKQLDSVKYYLKICLRLEYPNTTHIPVARVRAVVKNIIIDTTIYADSLSTTYKEITAFAFHKDTNGVYFDNSQQSSIIASQLVFLTGNEISSDIGYNIDYQVYSTGQVSFYIDYIAVDDYEANKTFKGQYDALINNQVDKFKDQAMLSRFVVQEEPGTEVLPAVGYFEQKIKQRVEDAGYPTKRSLCWNTQ